MICGLCKGHQNLFWVQRQFDHTTKRMWLACPFCKGDGTINANRENATIRMHMSKATQNVSENIFRISEHPKYI